MWKWFRQSREKIKLPTLEQYCTVTNREYILLPNPKSQHILCLQGTSCWKLRVTGTLLTWRKGRAGELTLSLSASWRCSATPWCNWEFQLWSNCLVGCCSSLVLAKKTSLVTQQGCLYFNGTSKYQGTTTSSLFSLHSAPLLRSSNFSNSQLFTQTQRKPESTLQMLI